MALFGAFGQAQAFDGREAGLQAAHIALSKVGTATVTLGIVIAPYRYDAQQVVSGVASLLGNVPLIGMSSTAAMASQTGITQSVTVGVLAGDLRVETHWFPAYAQASREIGEKLMQLYEYQQNPANAVIVFADGFNGDAEQFCSALPDTLPVFGGLTSGETHSSFSYQIASSQSGSGGLAAALLRGNIKAGLGYAHGWTPVGNRYRVTRSRGFWLRTLDGRPASETYAHMFGYPARDWAFPPLNLLTRIYPLGIEQGSNKDLLIRAPLRVEADGSFRLNAQVRDGSDAYLLIGSAAGCEQAARQAAKQALAALGKARPVFALALVDTAWQTMLKSTPGLEIEMLQEELGENIPIIGGYTLGQIAPANGSTTRPKFLNQHMLVAVFGEPFEEK
jgi:hypothetical protein